MKRFVIVLIIVGGILCVCVYSMFMVERVKGEMDVYADAVFAAIDSGSHLGLASGVEAFVGYWREEEHSLVRFVRHSQVDEISRSMAKLKSLARFEDYTQLHAELSSISWQMEHICESEPPTLGNIM
ncbi:MAG: DUF4363 family protein [Oscillospiraceae bacterium]|jgi:hypothetical protein|nr:DUF4363 family protein [Oscillospiraceae bacterium]